MSREPKKRFNWAGLLLKLLYMLFIVLLVSGILVLCRTLVNKLFLVNYDNKNYAEYPEKLVQPMAFGDNYVVPYNLGNAAYQREDYELAEHYFDSALRNNPPEEEKECSIRVNLALAHLHQFPFDTMDAQNEEEVDAALETLYYARGVLTETGCACEAADAWTGHSEEAEALKRDIDEMIRKLTTSPPQDGEGDGEGDPPPPDNGDGDGDGDDSSGDPPPGDPPPPEDGDGNGNGGQKEDNSQAQEQLQQSLEQDLKEQKQNLDAGNYQDGGMPPLTYIDIGDTLGFGEGMQW